jgi:multidrug efflux pump subunit AcrA (membrane-fusion protein)
MSERSGASWIVYALAALLAGAIVAAVLLVGPAEGQPSTQTRTVTAGRGVVQSTVSGSGNVEASSQLDLGFKTSGTVTSIAVKQGQQVGEGQLVATLDPQSAEVTLQQARAGLQSAEASLAREEETDGESSSSQPAATNGSSERASQSSGSSSSGASSSSSSSSGSTSETSAATRAANIASARAAVKSDRLTVQSDEEGVADTRLLAPESGTIVSLGGEVGETVSGGGTSRASGETEESSGSGSGSGGGSGSGSGAANSSGSASSGSSSSAFAVLSDLSSMKLVVALSESEVGEVKRGQPATVTVEALKGTKLAAHVSEVAALPTSNSGVVSYDVTFRLDQLAPGLKAGMSATAEVVVEQAEGVNVPSSAISGGSVTVIEGAKQVRRPVTTGLVGDSATIVLSGLKAGERVALPSASTSGGASSLLSRLGSRTGGALGGASRVAGGAGGFAGAGGFGGVARGGAGPGG